MGDGGWGRGGTGWGMRDGVEVERDGGWGWGMGDEGWGRDGG